MTEANHSRSYEHDRESLETLYDRQPEIRDLQNRAKFLTLERISLRVKEHGQKIREAKATRKKGSKSPKLQEIAWVELMPSQRIELRQDDSGSVCADWFGPRIAGLVTRARKHFWVCWVANWTLMCSFVSFLSPLFLLDWVLLPYSLAGSVISFGVLAATGAGDSQTIIFGKPHSGELLKPEEFSVFSEVVALCERATSLNLTPQVRVTMPSPNEVYVHVGCILPGFPVPE